MTEKLPPLKAGIEAIQIEHQGKPAVLLRDQEGLNEQSMAITMPAFMIAMMLDGNTSVSDIQSNFSKATGQLITPAEIDGLVAALGKADLLETAALQEKRRRTLQAFLDDPVRKPAHAKGGYPDNTLDLAAFLGAFFQDVKGPKKQLAPSPSKPTPLGLFAPHIDFHRGGPAYAWTYQALSESERPDTIVALGVAHMSPNSPWVFTKKSYETPYGPLAVAGDVYRDLEACLWYDVTVDQAVHRTEHSLEFQALWLKYLWRDNTPPWVPILCSSFDAFCMDRPPSAVASIEEAIQKMGAALKKRQDRGEKILILAGVDLAHVGPRFGDELKLGPELDARVEKEDRASLALSLKGDADAFYMSVVAEGHWRKWCGLSAIYTALRLMKMLSPTGSIQGDLLTYGQAPDPAGGLVSFTGVLFPR
jgi:AmmeMemoRadiSam system protein B